MSDALCSDRLVLRPVAAEDVDNLVALNSDEGVMRYLDHRPPSRDAVRVELENLVRAQVLYPRHGRFAALDATGDFVGWFGLRVGSGGIETPELGYRLRRRFWGLGLATEGSRALVDLAFGDLSAAVVWAETMAVNVASRRVMEKLGMCHVRTQIVDVPDPLPGTEQGEVRYEIRRGDWVAPS